MASFYLDNDIARECADELRAHGHDVIMTRELGRARATDDEQLLFAAQQGRILVTHNWRDFLLLHYAWCRWPLAWDPAVVLPPHAGILVIPQPPDLLPREAAEVVHHYVQSNAPLANEYAMWVLSGRSAHGRWVRYAP